MSEETEKLLKLRARLLEAIEADKRARKGSDKTWKKECKKEIESIRNLIGNMLAYQEYQAGINVHGR